MLNTARSSCSVSPCTSHSQAALIIYLRLSLTFLTLYASILTMSLTQTKTRLPRLDETPAQAREDQVADNLEPLTVSRIEDRAELTARRRKVAGIVAGIVLAPIVTFAAINSYGYGYHDTTKNIPTHTEAP